MKKAMLLFGFLFLFAIGGIVTVNTHLLEKKDAVELTEHVYYGDKSVVDGVTIYRNTKYDDHIRWKTVYQIGETPKCHTEYAFSASGVFLDSTYTPDGVTIHSNYSSRIDMAENAKDLQGIEIAYRELLDETKPGESNRKIISLSDYEEYYNLDMMMLELPGKIMTGMIDETEIRSSLQGHNLGETYRANLEKELRIIEKFKELIKIPVLKNHFYQIAVEKNMEGKVCGWGYSNINGGGSTNGVDIRGDELPEDADGFYFGTCSAMTEDTCYFTFNTRSAKGEIVDTGHMPQGYGIYAFQFDTKTAEIDVEDMKNVYSLDPCTNVISIDIDKQQENLLIFSEEESERILTVVDMATMETKQVLTYAKKAEEHHAYIYEDFMVVRYTWDEFAILSRNSDGGYQMEYSVSIEDVRMLTELYGNMVFDWNGEKLLMSDTLIAKDEVYYYEENCSIYLAAFDTNGLIYYGEYISSLDTGEDYNDYYFNCMATEVEPLAVQWN